MNYLIVYGAQDKVLKKILIHWTHEMAYYEYDECSFRGLLSDDVFTLESSRTR